MRGSVISFTGQGMELARKIRQDVPGISWTIFTKCSALKSELQGEEVFVEESISSWAKKQMNQKHALLFIGACGIAVRAIAPCLTGKLSDSPVLVLDEKGKYVIPVLSGHMGGANELALFLAEHMGMEPVVTTATDIQQVFAVDLFAKRNDLMLCPKEGIVKVSAKLLAGNPIRIAVERYRITGEQNLPPNIEIVPYPPQSPVDVVITEEETQEAALILKPKQYVVGVGCKKGKEPEALELFLQETLEAFGIDKEEIRKLVSIDKKKEEFAMRKWSEKHRVPFVTYSAGELKQVEGDFSSSSFVAEKVGVDNVCERAAIKGCEEGGILILKKRRKDGMTVAIAKTEWRVTFEET